MHRIPPNIILPSARFQFFFPPDKKSWHSSQSLPLCMNYTLISCMLLQYTSWFCSALLLYTLQ